MARQFSTTDFLRLLISQRCKKRGIHPTMVIVLKADVPADSPDVKQIVALAESFPGVSTRVHVVQGATRSLTEIYLLGATHAVPTTPFEEFEPVEKVVRITEKFRAIGRHG